MLRSLALLVAAVAVSAAAGAQSPDPTGNQSGPQPTSETWPSRPIKFIVPFTAGSSSDAVARVVGNKLGERLGQNFVIENRVGASGNLGSEAIARAEPDGYTIGLANTSTHAVAPSLSATLKYDPIKDFTAISMLGDSPFVMAVYPGLAAKTVKELVSLAQSKPRSLNYASAGPASMSHLAAALFEKIANVEMVHVAYRGTGQSVIDLIGGRIEIVFATIPPSLQLIREGKIRVIAVTGAKRSDALPEAPSISEAGFAGAEASLWQAIVGPPQMPAAIVMRLNREIAAVLNDPPTHELLATQGVEVEPSSPEQLVERIKADIEKWRSVIRSAKIAAPQAP